MGTFLALFLILISVIIYFLPSIIAEKRKHNNSSSIIILNLFLGWTFLGWVIALAMSFSNNVRYEKTEYDSKPLNPSISNIFKDEDKV